MRDEGLEPARFFECPPPKKNMHKTEITAKPIIGMETLLLVNQKIQSPSFCIDFAISGVEVFFTRTFSGTTKYTTGFYPLKKTSGLIFFCKLRTDQ